MDKILVTFILDSWRLAPASTWPTLSFLMINT